MATVGLNPLVFLNTKDSTLRNLMVELANRAQEINNINRKNQAAMIAEQVSQLFKK